MSNNINQQDIALLRTTSNETPIKDKEDSKIDRIRELLLGAELREQSDNLNKTSTEFKKELSLLESKLTATLENKIKALEQSINQLNESIVRGLEQRKSDIHALEKKSQLTLDQVSKDFKENLHKQSVDQTTHLEKLNTKVDQNNHTIVERKLDRSMLADVLENLVEKIK